LNKAYLYEKGNYIKAKIFKFEIGLLTNLLRNVHCVLPAEAALLCKEDRHNAAYIMHMNDHMQNKTNQLVKLFF